jgi:hypothetical protein
LVRPELFQDRAMVGAARGSAARTAFVMTSAHVFTVEAFPNGTFRTTVSGAPALTAEQRDALVKNMNMWENPPAGGNVSDKDKYCKKCVSLAAQCSS